MFLLRGQSINKDYNSREDINLPSRRGSHGTSSYFPRFRLAVNADNDIQMSPPDNPANSSLRWTKLSNPS